MLRVPACRWPSRLSVRGSPRRSSCAVSSSSGHRLPLLACPAPRLGLRCSRFVLCGCRDACRIVFPMGLAAACGGGVLVLVMLFVLACLAMWCRIALLPAYSTRRTGRYCGRSGCVFVLIGFSSELCGSALLAHFIRIGGLWCLRCGVVVIGGRAGLGGAVCSLTWWGWAVLSFLLIVLALLLRLIPMSCSFLSSSFLFALPPPVGSSLLAGLN